MIINLKYHHFIFFQMNLFLKVKNHPIYDRNCVPFEGLSYLYSNSPNQSFFCLIIGSKLGVATV